MADLTSLVAFITFLWTIYQQYHINKICEKCPYFPGNDKKVSS